MADASIPADLFNPGQVFACLGFLEAADEPLGDAAGGFDWTDEANVRFLLRASGNENPVDAVLKFLAESSVSALCPSQSGLNTEPVAGPLILGDGRYLGLGLMQPLLRTEGVHCFSILAGLHDRADPTVIARALRRAVMARVQERLGRRANLPGFFSGHEPDGRPSRSARHTHLALAVDLTRSRLLVVAPHVLEGRRPTRDEKKHLELLDESLADLGEFRAGAARLLELARSSITCSSRLHNAGKASPNINRHAMSSTCLRKKHYFPMSGQS